MQDLLFHPTVLLHEVVTWIDPQPGKTYLDVTFGSGGHTRAILQREKECRVIALDWDKNSLETYGPLLEAEFGDRITCLWGNFAQVSLILKKNGVSAIDGIIADFGTSLMQIRQKAGFSFRLDTPLDMRMSPAHQKVTASHIVNGASVDELRHIFWEFGQERNAKVIVDAIIQARRQKPLLTTRDLAQVIEKIIPSKGKKIHPATQVFQALRICVNKELENIHAFLMAAPTILASKGRIACISFHSLEDQMVKSHFQDQERIGVMRVLTKKVIVPSEKEVDHNPASRSARLRVAELL